MISGNATSSENTMSLVNAGLLLSVTRSVKVDVADVVGVPTMVDPSSVRPAGKDPETTDQV